MKYYDDPDDPPQEGRWCAECGHWDQDCECEEKPLDNILSARIDSRLFEANTGAEKPKTKEQKTK